MGFWLRVCYLRGLVCKPGVIPQMGDVPLAMHGYTGVTLVKKIILGRARK